MKEEDWLTKKSKTEKEKEKAQQMILSLSYAARTNTTLTADDWQAIQLQLDSINKKLAGPAVEIPAEVSSNFSKVEALFDECKNILEDLGDENEEVVKRLLRKMLASVASVTSETKSHNRVAAKGYEIINPGQEDGNGNWTDLHYLQQGKPGGIHVRTEIKSITSTSKNFTGKNLSIIGPAIMEAESQHKARLSSEKGRPTWHKTEIYLNGETYLIKDKDDKKRLLKAAEHYVNDRLAKGTLQSQKPELDKKWEKNKTILKKIKNAVLVQIGKKNDPSCLLLVTENITIMNLGKDENWKLLHLKLNREKGGNFKAHFAGKKLLNERYLRRHWDDKNGFRNKFIARGDGKTRLHEAVGNDNQRYTNTFLKSGDDINEKDDSSFTPLHTAVQKQSTKAILTLLSNENIKTNRGDKNGFTPLHMAAQGGNTKIVQYLLNNKKIEINCANEKDFNYTPLHYAVKNGHLDVVKALYEGKANTGAKDRLGNTALHLAALYGHSEIVKFLLEKQKTLINIKNPDGKDAFDLADEAGKAHVLEEMKKYAPNREQKNSGEGIFKEGDSSISDENLYKNYVLIMKYRQVKKNWKEILMERDKEGETFLHKFAKNEFNEGHVHYFFTNLVEPAKEKHGEEVSASSDEKAKLSLSEQLKRINIKYFDENFKLSPRDLIQLIKMQNNEGKTPLHIAYEQKSYNPMKNLEKIIQHVLRESKGTPEEKFIRDELRALFKIKDKSGHSIDISLEEMGNMLQTPPPKESQSSIDAYNYEIVHGSPYKPLK